MTYFIISLTFTYFLFLFLSFPQLAISAILPKPSITVPPNTVSTRQLTSALPPVQIPLLPSEFNINCGGPTTGTFITDHSLWLQGFTSAFSLPSANIGGAETKNLPMYKSFRQGSSVWGYNLPVSNPGVYECTAHFAELEFKYFQPATRIFDLIVSGGSQDIRTFRSVDITGELNGAEFTVLTKTTFQLKVQGIIAIRLVPIKGDAILSGFTCARVNNLPLNLSIDYSFPSSELIPSPAFNSNNQLHINFGGSSFSKYIQDDTNWITSGNTSTLTTQFPDDINISIPSVEGELELPALSSNRVGRLQSEVSYHIPIIQSGSYNCNFFFTEIFTDAFQDNARVFHVSVMDERIASNLDVFKQGTQLPYSTVVLQQKNLQIDSYLDITLTPVIGNVFISAVSCYSKNEDGDDDILLLASPDVSPDETASSDLNPDLDSNTPSVPTDEDDIITIAAPSLLTEYSADPTESIMPTIAVTIPTFTPLPSSLPFRTVLPSLTPIPSPSVSSSPSATLSPSPSQSLQMMEESVEPSPIIMPSLAVQPTTEFEGEQANMTPEESAETNSESDSTAEEDEDEEEEGTMEISVPMAELDEPLLPEEGQNVTTYLLTVRVFVDDTFSDAMKETLKAISQSSNELMDSEWALIEISVVSSTNRNLVSRQDDGGESDTSNDGVKETAYNINLQAKYDESEVTEASEQFQKFVEDKKATELMNELGFNNVDISYRGKSIDSFNVDTSSKNTSTSLSVIIGVLCALAGLVAVAVVAFYASSRYKRKMEEQAMNTPPPIMLENPNGSAGYGGMDMGNENSTSGTRSHVRNSNGGGSGIDIINEEGSNGGVNRGRIDSDLSSDIPQSVDYLDDDSTYTAATSRADDMIDNPGYLRDTLGRGAAAVEEDEAMHRPMTHRL